MLDAFKYANLGGERANGQRCPISRYLVENLAHLGVTCAYVNHQDHAVVTDGIPGRGYGHDEHTAYAVLVLPDHVRKFILDFDDQLPGYGVLNRP